MRLITFAMLGSLVGCSQLVAGIVCDGTTFFQVSVQQVINAGSFTCQNATMSNLNFARSGLDLGVTADNLFISNLFSDRAFMTPIAAMRFRVIPQGIPDPGFTLPPNSSS